MEKKPYTGELAKPLKEIQLETAGLLPSAEEWAAHTKKMRDEEVPKILLLLDHFEIDRANPRALGMLAYVLALTHVPGLQRIRPAGARKTWSDYELAELKIAVDDLLTKQNSENNKSITWACETLAKQEPWKSRIKKSKNPGEVLRRAYYKADPGWVEWIQNRFRENIAAVIVSQLSE